jgi:hypothetical protein
LCKLLKACQFFPPQNPRLLQEEEAPMAFNPPRIATPFPCELIAGPSGAFKKWTPLRGWLSWAFGPCEAS